MTETAEEPQSQNLARLLAPALEAVDKGLALCELPLPDRPFQAALDLIRYEFLAVRAGEPIDFERPWEYVAEPWFRGIFSGVEAWYRDQYGPAALVPRGNPPLEGVVLIRGSPFLLHVPMHRGEVEVEGKTAWMYFDAGLGEGEDARAWLVRGPKRPAPATSSRRAKGGGGQAPALG